MLKSNCVSFDVVYSNDFSLPVELQLQEGLEKSVGLTSAKVRNYIHDDLAFSILSKLPLKSVKRFGFVRKSWAFENPNFLSIFRNNFISNQHFYFDDTSLLLTQRFRRSIDLFSCERYDSMVKLVWPKPLQEEADFMMLKSGSITGIICLYLPPDLEVILWNPSTDEFRVTPPSPNNSPPRGLDSYIILHGFGYDQVNDDYKLLRFVEFFLAPDYDLVSYIPTMDSLWEIYSLRNNSWRTVNGDEPAFPLQYSSADELLYMDGMCHWWGVGRNGTHEAYFLSSFDLSNEAFSTTPSSIDIDNDLHFYLLVLNGYIGLMSWNSWCTTFHISILGQLGVKESWTKLFIVGHLQNIEHPIGASKNGKIFFRKEDKELILFDLSTQQIKELGVKGEYSSHVLIYKENLLPIGGMNN